MSVEDWIYIYSWLPSACAVLTLALGLIAAWRLSR